MATSRHVTTDTVEWGHTLFDHDTGSGRDTKSFRDLSARDGSNMAGGITNGASHRGGGLPGPIADLAWRQLDRATQLVESTCVSKKRRVTRPTNASDDFCHARLDRPVPVAVGREQSIDGRGVARTEDTYDRHTAR
jgi:hypothetical protein